MTVNHKDLTTTALHEPKDAHSASVDTTYVSDGAGSGTWQKIEDVGLKGISSGLTSGEFILSDGAGGFSGATIPHGTFYFVDITTPYTLTYPSTFTKIAPTTVAGGNPVDVTESTTGRLTYTGSVTRHFHIACDVSFDQTVGASRDIRFAVYKNGIKIANSEKIRTAVSGAKGMAAVHTDTMLAQNDYIELYAQNDGASGDLNIYTVYAFMMGMP